MYTVKNGGDIQKGDLVAISNSNDFSVGIYFGQGRGGTFQYYYPSAPGQSKVYHENRVKLHGIEKAGPFKLGRIWKSYVNAPRDTRILFTDLIQLNQQIVRLQFSSLSWMTKVAARMSKPTGI